MFKETVIVLCIIVTALACTPWDGVLTGRLIVTPVSEWHGDLREYSSTRRSCTTVQNGFRSARSASSQYECLIFRNHVCSDGVAAVNSTGLSLTPWLAFSFQCPFRC